VRDGDLDLARQLLDRGAVLLDVRTPNEYAQLRVPGAVLIPIEQLGQRLPDLLALVDQDRGRPIVIYCRTGPRAARAKRLLEGAGFSQVTSLGGIETGPLAELVRRGEPLWLRPPPDLRPIMYQFFRDFPFAQPGGPEWNPLAWSIGLRTGAEAEQLVSRLLTTTIDVPGLGPFAPYQQRALFDYTRGQIQAATGGAAFQPWEGFQEGAPQGFSAGANGHGGADALQSWLIEAAGWNAGYSAGLRWPSRAIAPPQSTRDCYFIHDAKGIWGCCQNTCRLLFRRAR